MIPFSPPRIDDAICNAVVEALRSGWITTGPRTKLFERRITEYCGNRATLCLNSATAGLELVLRWFGVGAGDEVIVPAYTYSATANVVIHCGATPVFADVSSEDFNIRLSAIKAAITPATKVIMPVDFGGMPCDYDGINALVLEAAKIFKPDSEHQKILGRILVLSDSAHSFGAVYRGKKAGALTDVSIFSFHAVKNLTTAEGGAIALNLPKQFDNHAVYSNLCIKSLHGQNKDALAKNQAGQWKYDIVEAGYKCNMTDISAAMGLVEIERYDSDTLVKRKHIAEKYNALFGSDPRFDLPLFNDQFRQSSYHLYPLRIKGINEARRDLVMQGINRRGVSVNVHFIPLPMLGFYKNLGYSIDNYKTTYDNYSREISLPLYYDLSDEQIETVVKAVVDSLNEVGG